MPLSRDFVGAPIVDPTPPEDTISGEPRADLITFDQWVRCFQLNMRDDAYRLYTHYWNGIPHDIRLKCGDTGWGYKHIRAGKENDWQAQLNAARSKGWVSESQGIHSWDDLMAAIAGIAITWPDYKGGNSISNTSCGVAEAHFIHTGTGRVVYTFRATTAWANDSDRLITAYPTSQQVC